MVKLVDDAAIGPVGDLLLSETTLGAGFEALQASVVVGNTIFSGHEAVGMTSWEDVDTTDPGSLPGSRPDRDIIVQ
jgi:hypothetical protein